MTVIRRDGEVAVMLRSANGEVAQDVQRRAYAVQKRMKRLAPVWTGALRDGIHVQSSVGPNGPVSHVISEAPHTLVAELGRGPVSAGGLVSPSQRRTRVARQLARGRLTWASDRTDGASLVLTIRLRGGGTLLRPRAREAEGKRFMLRSVDAALD